MSTERTLAVVKPGAVKRHQLGEILEDVIARTGLTPIQIQSQLWSRTLAEQFYAEHRGKGFFEGLIAHATSGPCYAAVLEGGDAIQRWRAAIGPSDPHAGLEGRTLRWVYGVGMPDNALHGSDSPVAATREIGLLFPAGVVAEAWTPPSAEEVTVPRLLVVRFQRLHPDAQLPERKTAGAAGYDLVAVEDGDIPPRQVVKVRTGIAVAIPEGYEGQVRTRSGLGSRGIQVVNSPGTVDSDYRGELVVMLINQSPDLFTFAKGDRVGQLVITRHETPLFQEVEALDATARGSNGFGSTGR